MADTIKIKGRAYKRPNLDRITYAQAEAIELAVKAAQNPIEAGVTAPWRALTAFIPDLPEETLQSLDLAEVYDLFAELGITERPQDSDEVTAGESSPS